MPSSPRSFAGVDRVEAMRRAEALIPTLRDLAAGAEQATRMTAPMLDAIHATGLFRYHQPKRWGGMELDFVAVYDVPETLGRGDASAAWTFTNLSAHHRMLALWDPRAQEEVWGEDPDALIASGIAYPQGRARRVYGGLELSGEWGFSSGVDVSTWNMLACVVRDGDTITDWCMCLLPAADYQIVDDWQTLGMRGTGSRTVRAREVFVPAHRVLSMHVARPGHSFPGWAMNPGPLYRMPHSAFGGYGIGGSMIGNARAALDATIELVKARSTSYTGARMRDFQTVQVRIGAAGAKIDAARLLLRHDCLEAQRVVEAGGAIDTTMRLRCKRNAAAAMRLATEAVDSLHELAGAHGIYEQHALERMFRDQHAAAGHISFSVDAQLAPWGLVALGGEVRSPTL